MRLSAYPAKKNMLKKQYAKFIQYPYTYLFSSILILLTITPLFEKAVSWMNTFFLGMMLLVIWSLELKKKTVIMLTALGTSGYLLKQLAYYYGGMDYHSNETQIFSAIAITIYIAFFVVTIMILLNRIFSVKTVTVDTIKGGISLYFLMGVLWTMIYMLILLFDPQALSIPVKGHEFSKIMYFSFTTLTTLGYGDISPVSYWARNMSVLESTLGQIFMTVFVATLVGKYLQQRPQDN